MSFEKLTAYMDALGDSAVPARDLAVWQDHQPLYRHMAGFSDAAGEKPVSESDVYLLYSSTKLITCVGALRLVEKGQLFLEDSVSDYLPEFAKVMVRDKNTVRPPKTRMTIKDLFKMSAGLSYNKETPALLALKGDKTATTRDVVRAFADEPLLFDPSTSFQYSLCHDVLGAIIDVVSGKSFGEYLKQELFVPLGMKSTGFRLTPEMQANRTTPYQYDEENNCCLVDSSGSSYNLSQKYESGGAGIYSTTDDYIRFADALSCSGMAYNGYRVLRPETVQLYGRNHLGPQQLEDFQKKTGHLGHGYGLGVSVLLDRRPRHFSCPEGIFGWGGAAGTRAFIDIKNKISVFYAQEVLGGPNKTYEEHQHNMIINMVYEALNIK